MLSRLDGVVEHRDGSWRAFSPFQERRRSRTLAIREADDGTVLLHDFGGHDTRAILQALGLELGDLFPRAASLRTPVRHRRPDRPRLSARDALDMLSHESWVLVLFGRRAVVFEATPADWQRAREALDRIERLRSYVR